MFNPMQRNMTVNALRRRPEDMMAMIKMGPASNPYNLTGIDKAGWQASRQATGPTSISAFDPYRPSLMRGKLRG